jgi:hypothetical protein
MSATPAREELLGELRRRIVGIQRPAKPSGMAATGIEGVDRLLGGGVPRGRMTEIVGRRSSGRTALAIATLSAATRRGEAAALIDVDGMVDVRSAEGAGIALDRLLWVNAGDAKRGIQAADLVLRAGGFGVVVLDVGEVTPRAPDAAWLRLARDAEGGRSALLLVSPWRVAGTFAAVTVETSRPRPRFVSATAASPKVVTAVEACIAVVRSKLGVPGGRAEVAWRRR